MGERNGSAPKDNRRLGMRRPDQQVDQSQSGYSSTKDRVNAWLDRPVSRRSVLIGAAAGGAAAEWRFGVVGRTVRAVESLIGEGYSTQVSEEFQVIPTHEAVSDDPELQAEYARRTGMVKEFLSDGGRISVENFRDDDKFGFKAEQASGTNIDFMEDGFLYTHAELDLSRKMRRLVPQHALFQTRDGLAFGNSVYDRPLNSFYGLLAIPRSNLSEQTLLTTGTFNPGTNSYHEDISPWAFRADLRFNDPEMRAQGWEDGEYAILAETYAMETAALDRQGRPKVYRDTSMGDGNSRRLVTYDPIFENFTTSTTHLDALPVPPLR